MVDKVIILMKSGRELHTNHTWPEVQAEFQKSQDGHMVLCASIDRGETYAWTDIQIDCVEGYFNIG